MKTHSNSRIVLRCKQALAKKKNNVQAVLKCRNSKPLKPAFTINTSTLKNLIYITALVLDIIRKCNNDDNNSDYKQFTSRGLILSKAQIILMHTANDIVMKTKRDVPCMIFRVTHRDVSSSIHYQCSRNDETSKEAAALRLPERHSCNY